MIRNCVDKGVAIEEAAKIAQKKVDLMWPDNGNYKAERQRDYDRIFTEEYISIVSYCKRRIAYKKIIIGR